MLEMDGDLDEVVNVERGAPVGASVVVFDLFNFVPLGVDPPPNGFIRYGGACTRDAVDDEDGVGHGIGGD